MKNISVFLILILLGSCNTERTTTRYCNFSYPAMKPDSLCKGKLNVEATYNNKELNSIKFFANGGLIQEDTVVSSKGVLFYVSHYSIGKENLARVTAILNDTARTFVFLRNSINYELAFLETPVSTSSIKIQFALPAALFITNDFDLSSVVKLREKYEYLGYSAIHLLVDYSYSPDTLTYEVLGFDPKFNGYGGGSPEKIVNFYNCMYLDIISIEDSVLLPLSKQLRRIS